MASPAEETVAPPGILTHLVPWLYQQLTSFAAGRGHVLHRRGRHEAKITPREYIIGPLPLGGPQISSPNVTSRDLMKYFPYCPTLCRLTGVNPRPFFVGAIVGLWVGVLVGAEVGD